MSPGTALLREPWGHGIHGLFGDEMLENGQTADDGIVADAVADPEPAGATEAITGHYQQIFLLGGFAECIGIPIGGFDE